MRSIKTIAAAILLAVCAALAPVAIAAPIGPLQVLTAGSSPQFGPFAVAAYSLARAGGVIAYHYTVQSSICPGACYASINDSRTLTVNGVVNSIPPEPGGLWVVWSSNGIWAYLNVDSTVAVRAFSAVPRATLALAPLAALPLSPTTNYYYWAGGTIDTAMPAAVFAALNGTSFTAVNSDLRIEDALFATNRALNLLPYGKVADPRPGHAGQFLIGKPIPSHFNVRTVTPVSFAIDGGADPFGLAANPPVNRIGPAEITIPVGAGPLIFLANASQTSDVKNATNLTSANAAYLFSGAPPPPVLPCAPQLVVGATGPVSPILRDPLSDAMNIAEFSIFFVHKSQETPLAPNPAVPCGATERYRATTALQESNAIDATVNSVGYVLFTSELATNGATMRYLELNGVDPLSTGGAYTGKLPTCFVVHGQYSCPVVNGRSFESLRNGEYAAWSMYRMITDAAGQKNAQTLSTKAQVLVDSNIPNFVPFTPVCRSAPGQPDEPGLDVYREHFVPNLNPLTDIEKVPDPIAAIVPNDGSLGARVFCTLGGVHTLLPLTLGGGVEAGGDVGGAIEGPFTPVNPPKFPGPVQPPNH